MSRPCGFRATWVAVIALAAGCQNYNFNPVGHCVLQPGSETFTLSNLSTADVLFVIDDSMSMSGEQVKLAQNFNSFIQNLNGANVARAAAGLQPIDFHIAVTTSSVFTNYSSATTWTCLASCGGSSNVCCKPDSTPGKVPHRCSSNADCSIAGDSCRTDCSYYSDLSGQTLPLYGEKYCCADALGTSTWKLNRHAATNTDPVPCGLVGARCGTSEQHVSFPTGGCTGGTNNPGVSFDGMPFPQGSFVGWANAWPNATAANPRVLHFDKQLYTGGKNRQGFDSTQLVNFFAGATVGQQANVVVGTCGSNQEQALLAGRLAVEKAIAGQQLDTYNLSGTRTSSTAEWPHSSSKLVLVFVGDEDDCSSPNDPSGGIVLLSEFAGNDACTRNDGGKQYRVAEDIVNYFKGLGRPLGAAFVVSTAESICGRPDSAIGGQTTACNAGKCCQPNCPTNGQCTTGGAPDYCGGQAVGTRFFQAASAFNTAGADVVMGSICDPDFGLLLDEIAKIVKPPTGLQMPTMPAEGDITVMRIADSAGETVKLCGRPLEPRTPTNYTVAEAQDLVDPVTGKHWDWWFTENGDAGPPVAVSKYVYINPKGTCTANPGETYSAEYLGRLPEEGCHSNDECRQKLGGTSSDWTCYAGTEKVGGVDKCSSTATATGTCLCGAESKNCPNGRL